MDVFTEKEILKTFSILVDTREQDTERSRKRYASFGCPFQKATLSFGDYTYQFHIGDTPHHDTTKTVIPHAAIERKMDLDELAQCFTRSRERFEREFQRAAAAGSRIYLLIENGSWGDLIGWNYKSLFKPNAFMASLTAWMVRYNMNVIFCSDKSSGRIIAEILYRDLKERIERGEFDDS